MTNIITKLNQYISESISRNRKRKVLFTDEYGKEIVYESGNYRIVVDDSNDARYITLWYKKADNKYHKIGYLDTATSGHMINYGGRNGQYLSIKSIEISKFHRNKGLGTKMYQALIDFCSDIYQGIYSYLPNRANKRQIPSIYKKFGGIEVDDYHFIDFKK